MNIWIFVVVLVGLMIMAIVIGMTAARISEANDRREQRKLYEDSRCPACRSKHVQWLPGPSEDAEVDYYRCADCGHVWNVPKDRPDDPPHHVTPLPPKKPE
jgi:transposase-like protein